jgi:hypothetical protein
MMKKLGVDMFPAHSPQAKGRIERFWQTLQGRLVFEFRMRGIKTMEAANVFLQEYVKKYARRFGRKPKHESSAFVPVTDDAELVKIASLLLVRIPRKTDSAAVFTIDGWKFQVRGCRRQNIQVVLSDAEGIWAETMNGARHPVDLLDDNQCVGNLPEVYELLIQRFLLSDAKSKFRTIQPRLKAG